MMGTNMAEEASYRGVYSKLIIYFCTIFNSHGMHEIFFKNLIIHLICN